FAVRRGLDAPVRVFAAARTVRGLRRRLGCRLRDRESRAQKGDPWRAPRVQRHVAWHRSRSFVFGGGAYNARVDRADDTCFDRSCVSDLDLGEKCALIMLPSNILCDNHTFDDFWGCMSSVRRYFAFEGVFWIDVFVSELGMLFDDPNGDYLFSNAKAR